MKKLIQKIFKTTKREMNFKQFSSFAVPCNTCHSDMLLFSDSQLICTNENCQKIADI